MPSLAAPESPAARFAVPGDDSVGDVTFSDLGFSSSDDEAGVFFGTPKAIERKIVASLSKTIPPSPASRDLARTAASGSRSPAVKRVKKRDSREFLRRKTLLLPAVSSVSPAEKVWEGNFYEKDPPESDEVQASPKASPSSEEGQSPNILDLTASLVTEPSPSSSSSSLDLDIFGNGDTSLESDFNKENTDIPEPLDYTPEPEYVPDEPEPTAALTLGMREAQLIDLGKLQEGTALANIPDSSLQLDLGGLNILDVDDPEVGLDLGPMESTADLLGSSDSESGGSSFRSTASTTSSAAAEDSVQTPEAKAVESTEEPEEPSVPDSAEAAASIVDLAEPLVEEPYQISELATPLKALGGLEVEDLRRSTLKPASRALARVSDASLAGSDTSFVSDIDSPKARGPVKIPTFSVPSPKHTPVRGLAPSSHDAFSVPEHSNDFALPSIDSPVPSPKPRQQPVPIAVITPEARQRVYEALPPSQRPSRILKSSHIRTSSKSENRPPTPTEEEVKTKERAQVIRSELDTIFKAKCAGFGLPRPQNASTSMANSTVAATPRSLQKPVKGLAESVKAQSPSKKVVKKALTTSHLPRPTSIPTAKKRPESSLSRPTAATAAKIAPTARPPLAAARRTTVVPSRTTVTAVGRSSVMVPIRPAETPVRMKHAYEQPASVRTRPLAVGVSARPTLGPAARLVRDPSSGGLVYATSGGQSLAADVSVAPRSPVAQFAPRSPAAHFTPRSPGFSLGRPARPGAPTPTPLRNSRLGGATRIGTLAPLRQASPTKSSTVPTLLVQRDSDSSEGSDSGSKEAPKDAQEQTNEPPKTETENSEHTETAAAVPAASAGHTDSAPNGSVPNGHTQTEPEPEPEKPKEKPTKEKTPSPPPAPAPEPSTPVSASGRPRRTPKPVERLVQAPVPTKAAITPSIAPGLSEKELKTQTQRNTMRNQVYFCAIDRQVVRVPGPRPPSPGPRTLAEKEEEEQKLERDARARRRNRDSGEGQEEDDEPPAVETVPLESAPGDEGEWKTPARKRKRVVTSDDEGDSSSSQRNVRWDRALTVFRGGLGEAPRASERTQSTAPPGHESLDQRRTASEEPSRARSALKQGAQIQLDRNGNAVDRPVEKLKRQKVTVTAVFYDGEEPAPEPAKNTRSKKKKNA